MSSELGAAGSDGVSTGAGSIAGSAGVSGDVGSEGEASTDGDSTGEGSGIDGVSASGVGAGVELGALLKSAN